MALDIDYTPPPTGEKFMESDGNIFPGQAYEVEAGGLYVQIFRGAEMLAQFVRAMAALFPQVEVYGAIGIYLYLIGICIIQGVARSLLAEVAKVV